MGKNDVIVARIGLRQQATVRTGRFKVQKRIRRGNFHVSRILETSKCKIGMSREATGNSKIAQFKALKNRTVQGFKVRLGGNFDVSAITKTRG
jgi:hypothetical protein